MDLKANEATKNFQGTLIQRYPCMCLIKHGLGRIKTNKQIP